MLIPLFNHIKSILQSRHNPEYFNKKILYLASTLEKPSI